MHFLLFHCTPNRIAESVRPSPSASRNCHAAGLLRVLENPVFVITYLKNYS
jgi:hypothetical protein